MLSRFRSPREQKEIVEKIGRGELDIVIGTHRLLSKDVQFKNLGLAVIDEEQRFGVAQKERLKQLRANVHVLTLTATPIPRTLQMAMGGLREISIIATPPADRLAIRTFVCRFDPALLGDALAKELARGGQTFYVHNRVEDIAKEAEKIRALAPAGTRVAIGHGQMPEGELEKVMVDFVDGKFDVLVCTTIIESGLDIPRANTMIVNRADRFGLAQLYQMRGRIGRSRERAFCYLVVPDEGKLTAEASARLTVLQRFTELGAGFQIASHDLEIRGAGELLGAEQSGHVAAVGFELYVELLNEAVAELQGQKRVAARPVRVDARVDAYVPAAYVNSEALRIDVHRRLALAETDDELRELQAALEDRYGPLPEPVENLFRIQEAKIKIALLGADYLVFQSGKATVGRLVLGSGELRELRDRAKTAVYVSAKQEVSMRGQEEIAQAVELVDAILDARRAA